jgi:glycosyltransferase involved in cell wall biosynthesis
VARAPGRLKVLFVASSGQPGGAELALATYLEHLPDDVDARVLMLSPGPVEDLLARLRLPVAVGSLVGRPSLGRALRFERGFGRELRRLGPDVVHVTGVKGAVLCAPVARALHVPVVWHKVDLTYDSRLARPLSLVCDGVIPISRAAAASVAPRRVLGTVPPPVRLADEFRVGEPRPPATIGSVGRLVPYKGHRHVIEAAARVARELDGVRVIVAGGPAREAPCESDVLRRVAARHGVESRVELLGHVDRIETVLERLTVLVSATYRDELGMGLEGFGATLAEASWAGLPVVGTRGGGTAESVQEGITGLLVPPEDPEALAAAIASYLRDPARASAAGSAGRAYARAHFRAAPLSARLYSILRSVVGLGTAS